MEKLGVVGFLLTVGRGGVYSKTVSLPLLLGLMWVSSHSSLVLGLLI